MSELFNLGLGMFAGGGLVYCCCRAAIEQLRLDNAELRQRLLRSPHAARPRAARECTIIDVEARQS